MNAVETLEAAITKLEADKSASLIDAPLRVHEGPEWYEIRDESGTQVAPYMSGWDAELFVTLHRTIDPLLEFLRAARFAALGDDRYFSYGYAIAIAESILGES